MQMQENFKKNTFTGRIKSNPSMLLHKEILEPQFNYEINYFLNGYILIEKVMLLEYQRMKLIKKKSVDEIFTLLNQINQETLCADLTNNMSDIAFAIEQFVNQRISEPVPAWHMDRSRNDFQACAQLMFAREQVFLIIEDLFEFIDVVHHVSELTSSMLMPGYTHYQAAQIISPGFYLSAVTEQVIELLKNLLFIYNRINKSPLGTGAMSGLELDWDRQTMAKMLGFDNIQNHALISVASREWALRIAGELSTFSVFLSRFVTDLIQWGSGEYGFIDLPDQLSGISSAMPQKKNFTILERIRGKTAHISTYYLDLIMGQRNTAFTNLVEVSKEANSNLITLFKTTRSILKIFTTVMENIEFKEERMKEICINDYFGGFALANCLTLHEGIPYREAQAIVGRYIVLVMDEQLKPSEVNYKLLEQVCQEQGYKIGIPENLIREAFDPQQNLIGKNTAGATSPKEVMKLIKVQEEQIKQIRKQWCLQQKQIKEAYERIDSYFCSKG
ncbi:argininosuccinate lyase [Bacillus sp. FSL E2-0195]|uniref:argininosuccinate lyase n=1 Tax=Bacillus sp. FSL E2-0195 TaxID=2921363 RepID=UPI0030F83D8E